MAFYEAILRCFSSLYELCNFLQREMIPVGADDILRQKIRSELVNKCLVPTSWTSLELGSTFISVRI